MRVQQTPRCRFLRTPASVVAALVLAACTSISLEVPDSPAAAPRPTAPAPARTQAQAQAQAALQQYRVALLMHEVGDDSTADRWAQEAADGASNENLMWLARAASARPDAFYAREYLTLAAERGLPGAAWRLAGLYDRGAPGTPQDRERAFRWYYAAAETGYAPALAAVAFYLDKGILGAPNPTAAIQWYYKAARAGYAPAMTAYARMLAEGRGAQRDVAEARFFLAEAAAAGDTEAAVLLTNRVSANQIPRSTGAQP